MSLVIAIDDVKAEQVKVRRKAGPGIPGIIRTTIFATPTSIDAPEAPDASIAFLIRQDPGCVNNPHYHKVDEFQIVLDGKGKFGRHEVSSYHVHFARAYTPYGPLLADKKTGWSFMTLRSHDDPGAHHIPASQKELKQVPDRRPWQVSKKINFPAQGLGVGLYDIPEIKDDQGLFAYALTMAPHTWTVAPDPSDGDGQYIVAVKGSLVYDDREYKALTTVFIRPEEDAFRIQAGPKGLEGLILNLPHVKPRAVNTKTASAAAGFKKWQCELCSFAYDEALGMPEEGVAAGTPWSDVPDTWTCPDCGAGKSDFQMVEV